MAKKKKNKCVYCGIRYATTRDHVPPRSFYAPPLTSDLITVPSCFECNNKFGMYDEYVRDIFISLASTEKIPGLWYLRKALWDSFDRPQSKSLLSKIYNTIKPVSVSSPSGLYLGEAPGFDLNRVEFDVFFERLARGLLHKEIDCGYVNCEVKWNMSLQINSIDELPPRLKFFLLSGFYRSVGNGQFKYVSYLYPGKISSLFIIRFYDAIEFMLKVKEL